MNFFHIHTLSLHRCRGGMLGAAARIMLALIVGAAAVACGGDDEIMTIYDGTDGSHRDKSNIYLTLNVEIAENLAGQSGSVSRAGDDSYFFERPLSQNEKLNDLRVIIVKSTDNTVEYNRRVEFNTDGSLKAGYTLTFKITPGSKRIYLIGNDTALPDNVKTDLAGIKAGQSISTANLDNIRLSRSSTAPFYTSAQDIPMTEFFDIYIEPNPISDENKPTYLYKTFFVTRVATKYTIETPEDYTSLKIRLYDIATEQWLMPHDLVYSPGKYNPAAVINGISGRAITSFATPQNTPVNNYEIEFKPTDRTTVTDSEGKFLCYRYPSFYLTESPTPDTGFQISALVNNSTIEDENGLIRDDWYGQTDFPNLPLLARNTHVVVRFIAKAGLHCVVDVVPYRGCTLEPYFGLE